MTSIFDPPIICLACNPGWDTTTRAVVTAGTGGDEGKIIAASQAPPVFLSDMRD